MTVKYYLEEVKKLACKSKESIDGSGEVMVCDYGNVLITEEDLEIPLTDEFETNIDAAIKDNRTIEAF